MPSNDSIAQLLVEGKNDQHVIWALCGQYNFEEIFTVETPNNLSGGDSQLLNSIPVRLKIPNIRALGIVLDADQNAESRWHSIKNILGQAGYRDLPNQPNHEGTIIANPDKPKIGVWIMPNNQIPGMLENFVANLIPEDDELAPIAEEILQRIERESLNRYSLEHRPKAFIHTWLAWQESPGRPMGQAITAHVLNHDASLAQSFVEWLRSLFIENTN